MGNEPQDRKIDENHIRQRAHEIWVEEGKPEGQAHNHWLRAKWELEARDLKEELARLEQYAEAGKERQ